MRTFACSLLLLAACSQSFTSEGDASVDTPDASTDGGVNVDAGRPTLSACSLLAGATFPEGCFCRGPLVARGDYLYLQAQGLHVLAREDLAEVNRVDERPSAQGGLVLVGSNHLVSAVDFEEPPLRVYTLDDPTEPRFVTGFGSDTHGSITALDDDLLVTRLQGESATLVLYDLSRPRSPRERFALPLEGTPLALALSEARVFVVETFGTPRDRSVLRVLDREGRERGRLDLEGAPFETAALWRAPDLYLSGFGAVATRIGFEGDAPFVAAATGTSEGLGGALAFVGDLLVGGYPLGVFEGPALRPLAVELEWGSAQHLVASDGVLYASSGGSVTELELACE